MTIIIIETPSKKRINGNSREEDNQEIEANKMDQSKTNKTEVIKTEQSEQVWKISEQVYRRFDPLHRRIDRAKCDIKLRRRIDRAKCDIKDGIGFLNAWVGVVAIIIGFCSLVIFLAWFLSWLTSPHNRQWTIGWCGVKNITIDQLYDGRYVANYIETFGTERLNCRLRMPLTKIFTSEMEARMWKKTYSGDVCWVTAALKCSEATFAHMSGDMSGGYSFTWMMLVAIPLTAIIIALVCNQYKQYYWMKSEYEGLTQMIRDILRDD